MKMAQVEKKQLIIFILVTYGVTYALGLLMWIFYGTGADFSIFPNAQMLYPAAGVMLAYLVTKKGDKNLPRAFFLFFIVLTAIVILCAVLSVFFPSNIQSGKTEVSILELSVQALLIMGSVIFWILLLGSGNEKRVPMD